MPTVQKKSYNMVGGSKDFLRNTSERIYALNITLTQPAVLWLL